MRQRTVEEERVYGETAQAVCERLGLVVDTGLDSVTVDRRLAEDGANVIPTTETGSVGRLLLKQFTDVLVLVLLAAAVVSVIVGESIDAAVILAIVVLNAVIGFVQEYRAERAIEALRDMVPARARVFRGGREETVFARDLVRGDQVLLGAGDVVPADLRLLKVTGIEADESALTGESVVVSKHTDPLPHDLPLGDRANMAFKGTLVTRGHGAGVVTATGAETQLGTIAALLHGADSIRTPLQRRLRRFGGRLTVAITFVCVVVFGAGLLRGEPIGLMFLTAVSLAVAAVPEALPAVVTMCLAMGARTMSTLQSLVRRLPAVETLGSVTYICADKTGTLTKNEMHVEKCWTRAGEARECPPLNSAGGDWLWLLRNMCLNNDTEDGASADATELALDRSARHSGADRALVAREWPRQDEIPFDAVRKRMTTIHESPEGPVAFVKGAPETVVPLCARMMEGATAVASDTEALLERAEQLASDGYRVLAFAHRTFKDLPTATDESVECDLVFAGFAALIDPPREEVPEAVHRCREAGITPVMITGDHPGTALAIASRLGIANDPNQLITGAQLARLSEAELAEAVLDLRVYARVTPEQKIDIVRALQSHGEFAAMTGDGVNDAPALKQADIGVAMGIKGTEVAREAADMVLLDDNFATIVTAVAEGRRIFDNIRKFISYTMASNTGEIATLFFAPFLGMPIPLLPIHILWINLVTDGLPGLALAVEPAERGTMSRPPRAPNESVFSRGLWQHMVWVGLLIAALSLLAQGWAYSGGNEKWQTIVFTVLTFAQLFNALAVRSERTSLFTLGLGTNKALLGAVALTFALQLSVIYVPFLNIVFHTSPLSLYELLVCFAVAATTLVAIEIEKWFVRRGMLYAATPRSHA